MKQTAVEWLIENIIQLNASRKYGVISWNTYLSKQEELFNQAKEMEKQQIIDFAIWFNYTNTNYQSYEQIIEQYYNETFKKQ
jgi:hypothetical protein